MEKNLILLTSLIAIFLLGCANTVSNQAKQNTKPTTHLDYSQLSENQKRQLKETKSIKLLIGVTSEYDHNRSFERIRNTCTDQLEVKGFKVVQMSPEETNNIEKKLPKNKPQSINFIRNRHLSLAFIISRVVQNRNGYDAIMFVYYQEFEGAKYEPYGIRGADIFSHLHLHHNKAGVIVLDYSETARTSKTVRTLSTSPYSIRDDLYQDALKNYNSDAVEFKYLGDLINARLGVSGETETSVLLNQKGGGVQHQNALSTKIMCVIKDTGAPKANNLEELTSWIQTNKFKRRPYRKFRIN